MSTDEPIAFFISWTVYGTFLQGDSRWWHKRTRGEQKPQPLLEQWHRDRLNHSVILLTGAHREAVESAIQEHCDHRVWRNWSSNARSNHIHVVVTAGGYSGRTVRDQLKANATRKLRQVSPEFKDRPVWSVGGDWKCIHTEGGLEQAIRYVQEAQDRKHRDKP